MKISREEVLKIAQTSRIAIGDDEVDEIVSQLELFLSYAQRVSEAAMKVDEPAVKNVNAFREDVVITGRADEVRDRAPSSEENYFLVPSILERK